MQQQQEPQETTMVNTANGMTYTELQPARKKPKGLETSKRRNSPSKKVSVTTSAVTTSPLVTATTAPSTVATAVSTTTVTPVIPKPKDTVPKDKVDKVERASRKERVTEKKTVQPVKPVASKVDTVVEKSQSKTQTTDAGEKAVATKVNSVVFAFTLLCLVFI